MSTHIDEVKEFLSSKNVNIPFFIGGGSVFSIINDLTDYGDIDVYFYIQSDIDLVISKFSGISDFTTPNSMNFGDDLDITDFNNKTICEIIDKPKIQFIIREPGHPQQQLNNFDLNCSRCSFNSEYQFYACSSWSKNIEVNEKRITPDILFRYTKYVINKGAIDKDYVTRNSLYNIIIKNIFTEYKHNYVANKLVYGYIIINGEINALNQKQNYKLVNTIYNKIITQYSKSQCLKLFSLMPNILKSVIEKPSDELLLNRIMNNNKLYSDGDVRRIKQIYPEYFI